MEPSPGASRPTPWSQRSYRGCRLVQLTRRTRFYQLLNVFRDTRPPHIHAGQALHLSNARVTLMQLMEHSILARLGHYNSRPPQQTIVKHRKLTLSLLEGCECLVQITSIRPSLLDKLHHLRQHRVRASVGLDLLRCYYERCSASNTNSGGTSVVGGCLGKGSRESASALA